ncbi:hypothetical protein T02_16298 [Trichinella nativa]|uniref:Uncharacterized protein n=1 Tax=Trichinella nativa TaxID=6335 RepID=A0A0V1L5S5_9BILA|nr:hypothetical protein T02_16298 [Trichinella nativa]
METELSKLQLNYLDKQIDEFFVSHCRLSCRYVASKGIRHPGNWLTYFHFFKEFSFEASNFAMSHKYIAFFKSLQMQINLLKLKYIKEKILSIVHYKFLRNQNERLNENDANENLYKSPFQAMQNFNENAMFN